MEIEVADRIGKDCTSMVVSYLTELPYLTELSVSIRLLDWENVGHALACACWEEWWGPPYEIHRTGRICKFVTGAFEQPRPRSEWMWNWSVT
jgi:hypothetical protein